MIDRFLAGMRRARPAVTEQSRFFQTYLKEMAASEAIPVAPPETFLLGLNLATALRLGIVAPPDLMQLAGPHIYR